MGLGVSKHSDRQTDIVTKQALVSCIHPQAHTYNTEQPNIHFLNCPAPVNYYLPHRPEVSPVRVK